MATTGIVFDAYQGQLENLHGMTVGVIALALDDFDTDLIGSMATLDEITEWEANDGGATSRATTDLAYAVESGSGVVRYDTAPPSLDLAGAALVNAYGFYDPAGATDADHALIGAIRSEPGAGVDATTPDEPVRGLFRVRRADSDLAAEVLALITSIDGGTE